MTYKKFVERIVEERHFGGDWHEAGDETKAASVVGASKGGAVTMHVHALVHHFGIYWTELAASVVASVKKKIVCILCELRIGLSRFFIYLKNVMGIHLLHSHKVNHRSRG